MKVSNLSDLAKKKKSRVFIEELLYLAPAAGYCAAQVRSALCTALCCCCPDCAGVCCRVSPKPE